ncbi:ATP-dependent DNA helicase RecG [Candidatus Kryptonium thompsonii]|jgi:ATP-dependent DNA helicase RecG|uniref:ATP-dependent DNA helicase RecG n=1 Tax=Candidatus Kryptonium thompsonii TaxID=1633631 RepID=A0A0P1NU09_9BACT|nr:helix-turn-helix domain-containing protein [Candidatus Kryptonium thompsoni]CUS86093.1 ATP-dependent DNA helicase RecG [Candidatus Kryptonium thompsoni]CUS86117.1 ATP-dependent DNA helicase RecG [Candidatus Kryptonium thompsoni]CUS91089.1 ATP-dependent DNA helicase RecG [Candidatus Kryptonium thompsoni]CUS91771.1 ATP-dependent DNA helicase RecG [Candidatus Kryptonium thompsoni]CUS92194.1 ATP-dependent DNA helicase RecG [Candidatus Kryptonium thompsoni]
MKNIKIEDKYTEFKEEFSESTLKTICAFANTEGGKVFIGIRDDGSVKGVDIDNKKLREITERIVTKLGIHPKILIKKLEEKQILEISVEKSNVPISYEGKYYERVGNTTREMSPERLKDFFLKTQNWDALTLENANFEEIDEESVRKFINSARARGRLTIFDESSDIKTIFEHLKLSINGKLTNGAIILFGKDPQKYFLNAVLRVVRLKNEATIIGDRLITGNLFKQVVEGETAIKNFLNVRYEIKGLERREIWDYPLPAIREALINAIIHRDYFKWNVQTQIKIFDDYIWFYNIGKLPEGITIEQLKKPHSSVPRNPLIVHIFYLAGLIEEVGSGIGRMIEEMNKANLPEPEFKEEMGGFSVYFRKDIYTEEYLRNLGLNERQIKAVMYVKEKGKITNKEYREINQVSKPTASRELAILVNKKILRQEGITGKGTFYSLIKGS